MVKNQKPKEFDPKDFEGTVELKEAEKMGYSFEQLNQLSKEGKLYHGSCMLAGKGCRVHNEYSTNYDNVIHIEGHVRI